MASKKPIPRGSTSLREANLLKRRTRIRLQTTTAMLQRRAAEIEGTQTEIDQALSDPDVAERVSLQIERHKAEFLTGEEKALIVELKSLGMSRRKIAQTLKRDVHHIGQFLKRYTPATRLSRMYFEANADVLAKRIVKHANVTESLEVMDRLDILAKKQREGAAAPGPSFQVFVGMPGQGTPVPSPREIFDARASESRKVLPSAE